MSMINFVAKKFAQERIPKGSKALKLPVSTHPADKNIVQSGLNSLSNYNKAMLKNNQGHKRLNPLNKHL